MQLFNKYESLINEVKIIRSKGIIKRVVGLMIESEGPICSIGEICEIEIPGGRIIQAEVVGFKNEVIILMPLDSPEGLVPGSPVYSSGEALHILPGKELFGRVINGLGKPIDGKTLSFYTQKYSVFRSPPSVINRQRITERVFVGIKAIDGLLTVGKGQRIGIFSGSGIGKSTILSMIARNTNADVTVIALIGERGREVREFIERDLGEEGLKKSILVVATAENPPLARVRAAYTATAVAEYFRDQGKDVMLLVDSITRLAMAQREISISLGEPPTTRGYSPSVFTMLPKVLERSGASEKGTITAFYSVLVEGDDMDEPISDAVRGILDGQVVLSRDLANKNHYPAIDVPQSISRLMPDIVSKTQLKAAGKIKELIAHYQEAEDLINIGAYIKGSNPRIDEAIEKIELITAFLRQGVFEKFAFDDVLKELYTIIFGKKEGLRLFEEEK
ncbi:FliI/YscN family ATPase [Spirochaetota bacterium]